MIRLKSSALLIAIVVGVVLTSAVTGVALLVNENTQMSGQSRDGKAAYRAALSGIEDGLLRYKIAKSQNLESSLFKTIGDVAISESPGKQRVSYDLSFRSSSVTVGGDGNLTQTLAIDDTLDIDLKYFTLDDEKPLTMVKIYFSKPYTSGSGSSEITSAFTAMNYRLIDLSKPYEEQLIKEATNRSSSDNSMQIDAVSFCNGVSSNCHLRIKPLYALMGLLPDNARRISGSTAIATASPDPMRGKTIRYAMEGYSGEEKIKADSTGDKPGLLVIESIGIAGQARRKIEAKIDASNGTYLGIFDYGVYCGDKCNWGTNGL